MGQATEKATRRQIRRAVGTDGLALVSQHDQALASLAMSVNGTRSDISTLARDQALVKKAAMAAFSALEGDVVSARADVAGLIAWRTRGFLARFRWLFTGQ